MDIENDREQLSDLKTSQSKDLEDSIVEDNLSQNNDEFSKEGSLGKFKDAESLLKAYNNLQAEFTKKCQSLSKLKNETGEDAIPIYQKEDWNKKVADFFEENKDAKQFASEIAKNLIEDDTIAKKNNALEIAWAQIASKKFITPEKIVEDDGFIENYVLNNDKIKNAVLEKISKDIVKAPTVMNSTLKGGVNGFYKDHSPKTMQEAKELAKKLFE